MAIAKIKPFAIEDVSSYLFESTPILSRIRLSTKVYYLAEFDFNVFSILLHSCRQTDARTVLGAA